MLRYPHDGTALDNSAWSRWCLIPTHCACVCEHVHTRERAHVQQDSRPHLHGVGQSIVVLRAHELERCFACMFCRHTQIFSARQNDLFVCLHRGQLFFSTLLGMLGDLITGKSP